MKEHDLKTWPVWFEHVLTGIKLFECRENDRDFQVGDVLNLREYDPSSGGKYTGRNCKRRVTYILHGPAFGVSAGYCIMQLQ